MPGTAASGNYFADLVIMGPGHVIGSIFGANMF